MKSKSFQLLSIPNFLTAKRREHLTSLWENGLPKLTPHIPKGKSDPVIDVSVKVRGDVYLTERQASLYVRRGWSKLPHVFAELYAWEGFRIGGYEPAGTWVGANGTKMEFGYHDVPHGHFAMHRDDDSPSTRSRVYGFVAAINKYHDYVGGDLIFPEIGVTARLPAGTALLFDAGLLHGVSPVVSGQRLVLISFLYA